MRNVGYVNRRIGGDDESLIDAGTASGFGVVGRIIVPHCPISGIVASPDGSLLALSHYGADSVSLVHTGRHVAVQTITGIPEPSAIAMADSQRAYVSTVSPAYDAITVIDLHTESVVASHPVALGVTDLATSPDGKHVYASRTGDAGADVAILDTATGRVESIDIAATPATTTECVRVTPDGQFLYVAVQRPSGGEIFVVDTQLRRAVGTIEIGSVIRDVALSRGAGVAYVASSSPDFGVVVDVVDTASNKITSTCKLGDACGLVTQLMLSGDGKRAYLVGDAGITVLCTLTHEVVGTVIVGAQPSCLTDSPDGKYLYVADYSGAVSVVSIASTMALVASTAEDGEHTTPLELGLHELPPLQPALT